MFIEVLVVFAGLSDESMRRVFVDLAVLIEGEYLLSAEIWVAAVCVRSGARRSACVCCDVVSYEALSMKMLSEVDGRVLSCCMTSSPLSIKTKDYSGLLGENLRGDCNGRCCADRK